MGKARAGEVSAGLIFVVGYATQRWSTLGTTASTMQLPDGVGEEGALSRAGVGELPVPAGAVPEVVGVGRADGMYIEAGTPEAAVDVLAVAGGATLD